MGEEVCCCSHPKSDHIYEEGACRPLSVSCGCTKFVSSSPDKPVGYQIKIKTDPDPSYHDGYADGFSDGWVRCWDYLKLKSE